MSTLALTVGTPRVTVVGGRATATASVMNGSGAAVRVVLTPVASPAGRGAEAWTTVSDPLRELAPGATEQFTITFAPPAGLAAGDYRVRFIAYPADEVPEEYADQAREVEVGVPATPVPPTPTPKKPPWWLFAVITALVLVAVLVAVILARSGGEDDVRPTVTPSSPTMTSASPTPSPVSTPPMFTTASIRIEGLVFLRDKEDFTADENKTVSVKDTVSLTAGQTGSYTWTACVGDEVQAYLDLSLTLDRATGTVSVTGRARYYEGTSCGETNLRRSQLISQSLARGSSAPYQSNLTDGNGSVTFNLVLTNTRLLRPGDLPIPSFEPTRKADR